MPLGKYTQCKDAKKKVVTLKSLSDAMSIFVCLEILEGNLFWRFNV